MYVSVRHLSALWHTIQKLAEYLTPLLTVTASWQVRSNR